MSLAPRFHRLAVNDLRQESPDAVSLTFAIPKELSGDYSFLPGQYLTLRTTMDGEEVRRSYSICSGPDDGELRIAVKKVDGGAFSSWAADDLKCGDQLDVMTPTGRFGVAPAPDEARVYAGFARPKIRTVLSPAWTTDWMSEDGRRKLREYGIAPPLASSSRRALFGEQQVACPQCGSTNTEVLSEFGSTSCKALWRCKACREPFDYFKCH